MLMVFAVVNIELEVLEVICGIANLPISVNPPHQHHNRLWCTLLTHILIHLTRI